MSAIYIHIPFCKQACSYCDFHFSTNQTLRSQLVEALLQEIQIRKDEFPTTASTLYFGGGSPSILPLNELESIVTAIGSVCSLEDLKEFTLETNPDDHHEENLLGWKRLGVNRLSIGIQSFIDADLELMNRSHDAQAAEECVQRARAAGFNALTIDLIYGIPGQSMTQWQSNVQKAISLETDHISAYCLAVEERTALHYKVEKGEVIEKDDETIEQEYLYLHRKLEADGFDHYEISNFGRVGKAAIHNSSYWSGQAYIGIGPSAHSFDGESMRKWNMANNAQYIKKLAQEEKFWEGETLSDEDKVNEYLMTGLRTKKGIDLDRVPDALRIAISGKWDELTKTNPHLLGKENRLHIAPEGWLLTDMVLKYLLV